MGMSTHAVGFNPADEKWNQMKSVWETCETAGTEIPGEVLSFFDGEPPKDKPGMEVDLETSCKEWGDDYRSGYEIDITTIPERVRYIHVYNSWLAV